MRTSKMALALVILSVAGCGSEGTAVMPDVQGKKLDAAKSTISNAGIDDDVKVDGGGAFGVLNDSNWQVCVQSPAPGAVVTGAPQLTIDRACSPDIEASTSSTPTDTTPKTLEPSSPEPASDQALTKNGNQKFAAFLNVSDPCDETVIGPFVDEHVGETIRFNGSIGDVAPHGQTDTRYDILVEPGNTSPDSTQGPALKFEDVNTLDLNLSGADVPDNIRPGDRFLFDAELVSYNATQCLVFLEPVSTVTR